MNKKEVLWCEQIFAKLAYRDATLDIQERAYLKKLVRDRIHSLQNKIGHPPGALSEKHLEKYSAIYCEYLSREQSGDNKKSIESELAEKHGCTDRWIREIVKIMSDRLLDNAISQKNQRNINVELLVKEGYSLQDAYVKLSEMDRARHEESMEFLRTLPNWKTYSE